MAQKPRKRAPAAPKRRARAAKPGATQTNRRTRTSADPGGRKTDRSSKLTPARAMAGVLRAIGRGTLPSVSQIARQKPDPFKILVSTVISLRTKDDVTLAASERLFRFADTPDALATAPTTMVERAIYPAGFYKTKARTLRAIAQRLVSEYNHRVPDSVDELLAFKGVGRKTATLVVSLGYGVPAICVDTHVHRISNRMGLVKTKTPDATEFALMDVLPKKHWIGYNELLVSFGQQVCTPLSPHCSNCPLALPCPKVGVEKRR